MHIYENWFLSKVVISLYFTFWSLWATTEIQIASQSQQASLFMAKHWILFYNPVSPPSLWWKLWPSRSKMKTLNLPLIIRDAVTLTFAVFWYLY